MKKHLSQNKKNYIWILVLDVIENLCFSSLLISMVTTDDLGWAAVVLLLWALRIWLYVLHGVLSYGFTKSVLFPTLIFLFATVLSFAEIPLFMAMGVLSGSSTIGLLKIMIFTGSTALGLHLIFSLITKLVLFVYNKLTQRKKIADGKKSVKSKYIRILVLDVAATLGFAGFVAYVIMIVGFHSIWTYLFLFIACALYVQFSVFHGIYSYCLTKSVLFPSLIFSSCILLCIVEIDLFRLMLGSYQYELALIQFMLILVAGLHLIFSLITKLVLFLYGKLTKRKKTTQIENTESGFDSDRCDS